MSYEVTATRRRPQRFEDLVGQEFVAETLKNSIKSGKIAHAYLFAGPRGCGKTSSARILAKALNCQHGPTDTPCGTCSNCLEITKGSSLDVIEIDGASNTGVENIRQIKDEVLFPPNSCRYKIYIIDEVHMLSTSAFNALLKTIEEPPPHVIFIFATTELQKVPATIKSRCQQFNFRLVAIEKVKNCLAQAAAELNIQADDEALFWIARESTGSMRDAYTLFDQVVAFSDGHITYEKIRDKLGLVGIEKLNSIFESCVQAQTEVVLKYLDEFISAGISIEQLISNSADYIRSLLLIKNGISKEALLGNSVERYSSLVLNSWSPIQMERALSIFLQLYRDIRYSLSPRYELELAFSRMCWIKDFVSNMEVKRAIEAAQSLLDSAPKNPENPQQPQNTNVGQNAGFNQRAEVNSNRPVPNGLPTFSMLSGSSNQNDSQGDSASPFYDGGSLPPEQSVNEQNQVAGSEVEKKEIDERLKIHLPEEFNAKTQEAPVVQFSVPVSDSYSENPDDEDDDWSNVGAPEENDYESYEPQYYEEPAEIQPIQSVRVQLNEKVQTADGNYLSVAQLRGQVMAALSLVDGFASAALEKTSEWICYPDSIETKVPSAYDLSILEKKKQAICDEISKILGKNIFLKVGVEEIQQNEETTLGELPPQVELLVSTFRGTVIAGK